MRPHGRPNIRYNFNLNDEINALRTHLSQDNRRIPRRTNNNVLIATWNLTNFGEQNRSDDHIALMAKIIEPFDVVAIQEISDLLTDLYRLVDALGSSWDYYFSDIGGNKERLGYLYRRSRVIPNGLAAELAMRGYERKRITIDEVSEEYEGFNRNPYMLGFTADDFEFTLVNVHLYWSNMSLRRLETKALAKWAESRVDKAFPPNNDIILIGDFNMPGFEDDDLIYQELTAQGLTIPDHRTNYVGTNLAGDKFYDQIAFFPSRTGEDFNNRMGVVDFDSALFRTLYDRDTNKANFYKYMRYYIADHRPLWAEFLRTPAN